jgi:hypothetical protein
MSKDKESPMRKIITTESEFFEKRKSQYDNNDASIMPMFFGF